MSTRTFTVLALLTTAFLSTAHADYRDGRDNDRGGQRFELCRPYRAITADLTNQVENFEIQVVSPIRRALDDQRSQINIRQSDEQKLATVLQNTQNDVINGERRLADIPRLIVDAQNSIKASQDALPGLEQQSAQLQREFDAANGWFARAAIKVKISNMNDRIQETKNNIQNRGRDITNMQAETQRLPAQIAKSRADAKALEINLFQVRNQKPSIRELMDREQQLRNQLDSQGEMRARLERSLSNSRADLDQCRQIDEDAATYRELGVMITRLRAANCDVESVRNRLPYDISDAAKRALEQANTLVCSQQVRPVVR